MPRPSYVPYETLKNVLKDLNIFEEDSQCLKKERTDVWEDARLELRKLGYSIVKHSLYMYVYKNSGDILSHLKRLKFGCNGSAIRVDVKDVENKITENELYNPDVPDDYDDLHAAYYSVQYLGIIENICPRAFHSTYCLPEQVNLSKDIIHHTDFPIVLFVIGNAIKSLRMQNHLSNNNYLFLLGSMIDGSFIPIIQSVSKRQILFL